MSFSKCFNLETKNAKTSNFVIKDIKSRAIIPDKQNLEKKAFKMGFVQLKIKLKKNSKLKTTKIKI